MDQAAAQSVDSAAALIESSGVIDGILATEEPKDQEPDAPQEAAEVAEPEVDESEADDSEEQESLEADDSEVGDTEESEEPDSQEEQIEIESIDSLAEALEASKDDLLDNLKIDVVIDGQTQTVTLREAQAGYQKDADYRRKTSELAEQRRAIESQHKEAQEFTEYQHQIAANVLTAAKRELMGELQNINLDELRQADPVAWTAKRADLIERQQQLQALEQQAQQAYYQFKQKQQQETAEARQKRLAEESEALTRLIPNFSELKPKLDSFLTDKYGFSNEELASVDDHRIVDLARKAMLYDQSQAKVQTLKPKVKKAPKAQKPAPQAKPKGKRDAVKVAKSRLKKSGHVRDAAAAIESLL